MKISVLGPEGTISHIAAKNRFPEDELVFVDHIDDLFTSLENKSCELALIPIDNSISGFIEQTIENLLSTPFYVSEEIIEKAHLQLVGFGKVEDAHTLFAHPHSYRQCYHYIQKRCPNIEVIYTSSNAASAQKLKEAKTEGYLAVVTELAQKLYHLPLLDKNIEDAKVNQTRFLVLSPKKIELKGKSKAFAFLFTTKNKDLLLKFLKKLGDNIVNLKPISDLEIGCHGYFLEWKGKMPHLEGIQVKHLGDVTCK